MLLAELCMYLLQLAFLQYMYFNDVGWATKVVDGRPRVLHLRWSSASWLDAQSLSHIGHCDEKNVWIEQTKIGCHGNVP